MKHLSLVLVSVAFFGHVAQAGNWFGPGPWANDGYYPGYLDGKYQASVTGVNIIGVVGFAINDGAPTSIEKESETASFAGDTVVVTTQVEFGVNPLENYFLIFHEGRTYSGETLATIDLSANTVTGALRGTAPASIQPFTAAGGLNAVVNVLPVLNRGLSGGFLATIQDKAAVFTFSGTGQLSSAANEQTANLTAIPAEYDPADVPPSAAGTITNLFVSGQVTTTSTPFTIQGIRSSFTATNTAVLTSSTGN